MLKLKRFAIALVFFAVASFNMYASADNSIDMIADVCVLKGNLYYCDHNAGKIVMKNVSPITASKAGEEIAKAIEYSEVNISAEALYMKDGTKAEYDWLNNNADDVAHIIVARCESGALKVMYFQFK